MGRAVGRPMKRLGVLVSGEGTNLQALLDAKLPADFVAVVSNRPEAPALKRAAAAGVPAHAIVPGADREAHEREIARVLDAAGADLVLLAGYMRLFTPWFVRHYAGRILNIHPSLLPAFRGARAVRQALDAGVKVTGCTVHFVTEDTDAGPIVAQAAVPVHEDDDEAALAARIHVVEHRLYPEAVRLVLEGRAVLEGTRVRIREAGA